jgi:hypothetical protein
MTLRSLSNRAKGALCASLLVLTAAGCDEDGKTAPEKCGTPPLEIFDIQNPPSSGGEGAGGEATNPCVTPVGHAISPSAGTGGTGVSMSGDAGAGGA